MTTTPTRSFLSIDLGAGSGRVIRSDWDGKSIRLNELHRFPNRMIPLGNGLHWDLIHLWNEALIGLQRAVEHRPGDLRSVGVDTWALDYALLSPSGEMLGLPRAYRDPRTAGLVTTITDIVPRQEIFRRTGLQFMEINSLFHLYAQSRQSPELLETAKHLLMIPDWFHWCLSGTLSCEFTNATTTQFLDPIRRDWAKDLLDQLAIPHHFLLPLTEPGTNLGAITPSVIRATGLPSISVVAPATHDTASAVVAVPTERTGSATWAYLSSGTWSLVGVELSAPLLKNEVLEHNFTNEGGVDHTFRLLKNVMGLWLMQQLQAALAARGTEHSIPQLVELANDATQLVTLIDPDADAFLRPTDLIESISEVCNRTGQPTPSTAGAWARCILESLALRYREVLATLASLTGIPLQVVHIVGGGSKNLLLNRFTSDATGLPVIAGPSEATAIGNAAIQMRTDGVFSHLSEIRSAVRASCRDELQRFEPDPTAKARWDDAFGRWIALFRSAV